MLSSNKKNSNFMAVGIVLLVVESDLNQVSHMEECKVRIYSWGRYLSRCT